MTRRTEVVVVGGGATGVGVARDLAMRGVDVTLFEQGNLTHGTSGRMHGLLHSGARYAVADPESARECVAENRVLRDVASHCVEPTGGFFVQLPDDPDGYFEEKLAACRDCDIPVETLTGAELRAEEPHVADAAERAIRVPDAAIDPFRLCVANAASAENHGGRVETHAAVTDVLVEDGDVVGVEVSHADESENGGRAADSTERDGRAATERGSRAETEEIRADHVVNATGAWAGRLAAMAGVDVDVRQSKGAMVVTNCRRVDSVLNRCRPKGDADILVPHETTAILGTTDVAVDDPEDFSEDGAEVDLLLDELSQLVPILRDARTVRSFWGVRPLYEPPDVDTRNPADVTRDFFLLDHAARDDLSGLTTIVGGKLTTYRLMAERVADHVCDALGVRADCRTADEALPGSEDPTVLDDHMADFGLRSPVARRSRERLGSRAEAVLDVEGPNPVLCDCEGVTRAEVRDAIDRGQADTDLNEVRIRTRASMGTCQGGFCCARLVAELHPTHDESTVDAALDDLWQERWKGERHALWGEQLSQAALNYALHATTLNRDGDTTPDRDGDTTTNQARDTTPDREEAAGDAPSDDETDGGESIDFGAFDAGEPEEEPQ